MWLSMRSKTLMVNEVFFSIEGEGRRAGELAAFIRLMGCNLRCSYCDTEYAFHNGVSATAGEIAARVNGSKNITLTGGEPLTQDVHELISLLPRSEINIETNGSVDLAPYCDYPNVFFTMDYKCPSSGMEDKMRHENFKLLRARDCLKFVVGDIEDLEKAESICREYNPPCPVYISPVYGKIEPMVIVDYMKVNLVLCENWRVQLQLHKYIWNPSKRGV